MSAPVTPDDLLTAVLEADTAKVLQSEFGHETVRDLLLHAPRRYLTVGQPLDVFDVVEGDRVTVAGEIVDAKTRTYTAKGKGGGRKTMLILQVDTGRHTVEVTFFNAVYLKGTLTTGCRVMLDGTVSFFRRKMQLKHPEFLVLSVAPGTAPGKVKGSGNLQQIQKISDQLVAEGLPSLFASPMLPIYSATRKVTSWDVLAAVMTVLRDLIPLEDPLDEKLRQAANVIDLDTAIRTLHMPKAPVEEKLARRRLRFDEALSLQLLLGQRRLVAAADSAPPCPPVPGGLRAALEQRLPFDLTAGQESVLDEISADVSAGSPMSRLLQGEVGSGKTVIALLAMLQVVDAGRQCVLLAPTEVLAAQHYTSISRMLGPLGRGGQLDSEAGATKITLLTGSLPTAARRQALLDIVSGEAGIVIGTHALIQDGVEFFDLGLVVVDEQHRFGVRQRDRLRTKGRGDIVPHVLVMTATPIPRTVAITVFGDLAVSELVELPAGRQGISTNVVPLAEKPKWEARIWERVREEVEDGGRAYVVCSRIGDDAAGGAGDDSGDDGFDDDFGGAVVDPEGASMAAGKSGAGKSGANKDPDEDEKPPTHAAVELAAQLAENELAGLRVGLLHGRLPTAEKDATMTDFAVGELDVLVSTTVIEVGVDVPEATVMVIMDAERFGISQLHQLRGRVGRGDKPGLCLLVTNSRAGSKALERLTSVAATTDGFELARLDLQLRREGDVLGEAQSGVLPQLRLLSVVEDSETIELARTHALEILESDIALARHGLLAADVRRLARTAAAEYVDRT